MWLPSACETRGDGGSGGKGTSSTLGSALAGCWQHPTAGLWGPGGCWGVVGRPPPCFAFPFPLLNSLVLWLPSSFHAQPPTLCLSPCQEGKRGEGERGGEDPPIWQGDTHGGAANGCIKGGLGGGWLAEEAWGGRGGTAGRQAVAERREKSLGAYEIGNNLPNRQVRI